MTSAPRRSFKLPPVIDTAIFACLCGLTIISLTELKQPHAWARLAGLVALVLIMTFRSIHRRRTA